jgi:hypothetical protein
LVSFGLASHGFGSLYDTLNDLLHLSAQNVLIEGRFLLSRHPERELISNKEA